MSQEIPENLRYTKEHEWVRQEADGSLVIGITHHAVESLGDITQVDLPDLDSEIKANESFGDIDSVKAVSELFAPLDAKVTAINEELADAPEAINEDPYGKGWMVKVQPSNAADFESLLSAADYAKLLDD